LVGQGGKSPLTNRLTLVFEDGQAVTFEQDELVTSLAEQHQAAPSENQILKALQAKLEKISASAVQDWKTMAVAILDRLVLEDKMTKPRYILNTEAKGDDRDLL
jgi:transcriptional regulator NrdR family protein